MQHRELTTNEHNDLQLTVKQLHSGTAYISEVPHATEVSKELALLIIREGAANASPFHQ